MRRQGEASEPGCLIYKTAEYRDLIAEYLAVCCSGEIPKRDEVNGNCKLFHRRQKLMYTAKSRPLPLEKLVC